MNTGENPIILSRYENNPLGQVGHKYRKKFKRATRFHVAPKKGGDV
jgi:hypothetical protein